MIPQKLRLPIILILTILTPIIFGSFIPEEVKSFSYALSLSIKSILISVLPFIIFSFVYSSLINMKNSAFIFIVCLISCVFISNSTAIMYGYVSSSSVLSIINFSPEIINASTTLEPFFDFQTPKLISNDIALVTAFILGMICLKLNTNIFIPVATTCKNISQFILAKIFIPILPIFILGFIFKLEYENVLITSLKNYGYVFGVIILAQILYLMSYYLIASNFNLKRLIMYLSNMFPAALTGFSTISSAASMPLIVIATEKNMLSSNPRFAQVIVPAVINIHTLGSAIAVSFLAFATLITFNLPIPEFSTFIIFAFFFALAKFGVAAVPGGVMIVISPLLEQYLGFNSEMVGLMTAVYLIFDPFGTTANVLGNGAFPLLFQKLINKLGIKI